MKKFLLILAVFFILFQINIPAIAEDSQYDEVYYNLAVPEITFENDVDPYEAEDNSQFHVSPYPLLRVSSTLVFKDIKIPANYYLISPRKINDSYYVLFKQGGKVKYIIPIYETESVQPLTTYPQPPKKQKHWWDYPLYPFRWALGIAMGKDDPPPRTPQSLVKAYDLDSRYYGIDLYYNDRVYKMIFKKE